MTRRRAIATLAVLVVATLAVVAAAPATGQQDTAQNYTLDELRDGGTTHAGAPTSMRYLSQYGSATLRHTPVGLGSQPWTYVGGDTLVKRNEVSLKTIRLGDPDEDLTVQVVGWQRGTRVVERGNKTVSEPVAENITTRTVEVSLGRGYDNATVPLPPSYGEAQRITMWVEGTDARWTFKHRSVATTQSIDISSYGDFLQFFFWQIGVYAIGAMLLCWRLARKHRQQAIVGPQWSAVQWLGAFAVPVIALSSAFAFQGAVLATRLPPLIGLAFGPVTYALTVEAADDKLETFLFRQQDLERATTPRGEDAFDSRYVRHWVKHGVQQHEAGEIVLIEKGMTAYIARLYGHLAVLDVTDVETRKKASGPYAEEFELDPGYHWHDALIHDAPRLSMRPLMTDIDVPHLGKFTIPNPAVVLPVGGGAAVGWFGGDATLGIAGVGAAVGALVGSPFVFHVEDGGAEAEVAPYHFTQADASLAKESEMYADSKELEQFREIAWKERMKTPLEAKKIVGQFDDTVSRKLNEAELGDLGMDDILDPDDEGDREVAHGDD